ncbi:MAG: HEAT repeat domain-containing protein [Bryobacteraceae bacterium]
MRQLILLLLAAGLAFAQGPRIGIVDYYGLHKVPQFKVLAALGVRDGDPLPRSKGDAEQRIEQVPGVIEAHLEAVCCDQGKTILYVGVEEKGATHFDLREPPAEDVQLPGEIATTYRRFLDASEKAARLGEIAEDLTNGYALSANVETRDIQQQFIPIAQHYLPDLRHVLRDSSDEEQRAIAAYVIGYAPDKYAAVDNLQFALKDADPGVRANATHGLKALAVFARLHPDTGVKIEPTWFIEMLNSLSWADRNQAVSMLDLLTEDRDPSALDQIHARALPSLIEMARWKTLAHALPAYLLLGRVAGLPQDQVRDAWSRGDREWVIAQVERKKK